MRLLVAAAIPLVIIQMITNLGGTWAYSTFGIISGALIPITFIIYKFGPGLRAKSKYSANSIMMMTLRTHQQLKAMP